jgi:hypothetical protein
MMNDWTSDKDLQDGNKRNYFNLDDVIKYSSIARTFQGSSLVDIISHQLPVLNFAKATIENKKVPVPFSYQNCMIENSTTKIRIFCVYVNNSEIDYDTPSLIATEYYLYLFNILASRVSVKRSIDAFFTLMFRLDRSVFDLFKQSCKYLGLKFEEYDDSDYYGNFIGKINVAEERIKNHQSFVPLFRLYYMAMVKQLTVANQSWLTKRKTTILRSY